MGTPRPYLGMSMGSLNAHELQKAIAHEAGTISCNRSVIGFTSISRSSRAGLVGPSGGRRGRDLRHPWWVVGRACRLCAARADLLFPVALSVVPSLGRVSPVLFFLVVR